MGKDNDTNGFGSSLTPEINIDCNFGDILKFPLIGSFFNFLVYTIVTPLLLVLFLIPLIITVYMSVYSCKTITFDAFANSGNLMEMMSKYKGVIIFMLTIMTIIQLYLSSQEDESFFSILAILLLAIIIFTYWARSGVKPLTATVVTYPQSNSRQANENNAFDSTTAAQATPIEKPIQLTKNSQPKRNNM